MSTNTTSETCKTCSETLQGTYCHKCGEKVVEERDFHFKTLLKETFGGIFNFDSKIFKSFYYLLLKPGKLTVNYIEGIRTPFMKPIQLFLVINVFFFLLLTQADILRIPAEYYFVDNREIDLIEMSQQSGISEVELRHRFDTDSANYSKALVIILIPFFALILMLVNFQKRLFYGKHIIFALHYFSFFLVFCVLLIVINNLGNKILQLTIVGANFLYLFFAIRTFYRDKFWISAIKAFITLVLFLSLILTYREFISNLTFQLLS
jgi:hypothetical protein